MNDNIKEVPYLDRQQKSYAVIEDLLYLVWDIGDNSDKQEALELLKTNHISWE